MHQNPRCLLGYLPHFTASGYPQSHAPLYEKERDRNFHHTSLSTEKADWKKGILERLWISVDIFSYNLLVTVYQ
jgi:hypothetical protein